jgi:hypothetical protein
MRIAHALDRAFFDCMGFEQTSGDPTTTQVVAGKPYTLFLQFLSEFA